MKRYFVHPESDSLFTTDGEDPVSDGCVEELTAEEYQRALENLAAFAALTERGSHD